MLTDLPLAEMSDEELLQEQEAAVQARAAAEFVDGLDAWRSATYAADHRLDAVKAELRRRDMEPERLKECGDG
jgi:hypothetical protein